jgi:hypothetical protein
MVHAATRSAYLRTEVKEVLARFVLVVDMVLPKMLTTTISLVLPKMLTIANLGSVNIDVLTTQSASCHR